MVLFQGVSYLTSCLQEYCPHAELHRKTDSSTRVAVQLVLVPWSDSLTSIGLKSFQIAYRLKLMYGGKGALLHILMSRIDGLSTRSQRSLAEVERSVTTKKKLARLCASALEP